MKILAGIFLLLLIVIYYWNRKNIKRGKFVFGLAQTMEKENNYEGACFHYAVAANAGHDPNYCHQKIRVLWSEYGPFEFLEQLKELLEEYCKDKSCGEGHYHITVQDIHKIVGVPNNKGAT